ncbi:MAG: hypothetical protein AB1598_01410 [Thermodesulfobacteriota bacterium]
MNILTRAHVLILISFFCLNTVSHAAAQQNADLAPLGFAFGISDDDAEEIIETNGKRIMDNKVDSKKIRTIVMQGMLVTLPLDLEGRDVSTGLEFYDDKLLSSSLILNAKDEFEESQLQSEFMKYLTEKYGEPSSSDSMLYFKSWTWNIPDVKLVFHTNQKKNMVKVEYTYEPYNQAKREEELDKLRGTEEIDPAKQMFLDGDYSKPKYYDETGH